MPSFCLASMMEPTELGGLVRMELQQMAEEGYDVESRRQAFEEQTRWTNRALYSFHRDLSAAPRVSGYQHEEPDELERIRAARPAGPRVEVPVLTQSGLHDRIYGAWLGRSAGCVLGKPIEAGWPKSKVIHYLKLARAYPLSDYIPRIVPLPPEFDLNPESEGFFKSEIAGVPYDDDLDYTVLGLHILEDHGLRFKTSDVGTEWLGHLPYFRLYTAERIAYRNLTLGLAPPETALTMNPAREFIGARIRSDIFGLVAPGDPELAAEMAYRDATLSHTKNGVYSAMFTAAMIAWAFVSDDLAEIVEVGLSEIPSESRLTEAVRDVMAERAATSDWQIAYDRLILKYGTYHPVHSINNTAWAVLALLYSGGDFQEAICTAVMCGLDTDCNGANVGTVMGVLTGRAQLPATWVDPLQDHLHTTVSQWEEHRISALAERTASIAQRTLSEMVQR